MTIMRVEKCLTAHLTVSFCSTRQDVLCVWVSCGMIAGSRQRRNREREKEKETVAPLGSVGGLICLCGLY